MSGYITLKKVNIIKPMNSIEALNAGYRTVDTATTSAPIDGFEFKYKDGPFAWMSKDEFEKEYRKDNKMSFGYAIESLRQEGLVAREGWMDKGIFIFVRPSDKLSVDFIINKVKSLPKFLKFYYEGDYSDPKNNDTPVLKKDIFVEFTDYLCMKDADGTIINGWTPSAQDVMACDWVMLD